MRLAWLLHVDADQPFREACLDRVELIAMGSDRPEGRDGVMAQTVWID